MYRVLILVLLTGCEPETGPTPYVYKAGCLTLFSEVELRQSAVEWNVTRAAKALSGIVPEEHFCAAFNSEPIYVHEGFWLDDDGNLYQGWTTIRGIYVTNSMASLTHELLHVWDLWHWVFNSQQHVGWDENGYNRASDAYAAGVADTRVS